MKAEILKIDGKNIQYVEEGVKELQEAELEDYIKSEYVRMGTAELSVKDGMVTFCTMKSDAPKAKGSKSKKEHIVNISGKDFMTYEGLLKLAHKKGKFDMTITESWVSEDMKMAWCKVRLTAGVDGSVTNLQTFDGFGSSTPDNTGTMTQSHPVEMAHTRAKGRALRDYLNIGMVMAEELKQNK